MDKLVHVEFLKHTGCYNPGEVAGFSEEDAKSLIERKLAKAVEVKAEAEKTDPKAK